MTQFSMLHLPEKAWTLAGCIAADNRDELARFWLCAPEDLLPSLWSSQLGEATKSLVRQLTPETRFTNEQVAFRNAIGDRFRGGLQFPLAPQLILANFLYSPPGLLRFANPESELPNWLLADYKQLYEQSYSPQVDSSGSQQQSAPDIELPQPDFGEFPATLQELINNRIQLNRLLGLSNLFYIDPEDEEILQELRQVRISLIEAIKCCPEHELEKIWGTDFGDRYWALVRSGLQKEPLIPVEENYKNSATISLDPTRGGGFGTPQALNSFLIAMLLYEPGTMRVSDAEQKIPHWLLTPYKQIFAEPLSPQN